MLAATGIAIAVAMGIAVARVRSVASSVVMQSWQQKDIALATALHSFAFAIVNVQVCMMTKTWVSYLVHQNTIHDTIYICDDGSLSSLGSYRHNKKLQRKKTRERGNTLLLRRSHCYTPCLQSPQI